MVEKIKILIIDDADKIAPILERAFLDAELHYSLTECSERAEAVEISKPGFDCIFLTHLLPDEDGLKLIKKLRIENAQARVVLILSHNNEDTILDALEAGAFDCLVRDQISALNIKKIVHRLITFQEIAQQ